MSGQGDFRLLLTGDSIIQRRIMEKRDPGIRALIEMIQSADVAFTNLEVLPNDFRGHPNEESGGTHFGAPAWVLDELLAMGFDLFACATNHTGDFAIEGLLAMIDTLESREAVYAGIGNNLAEARMPAYFDHGFGSIAMISCSSTYAAGQSAGVQRPDFPGRPGLNPLRHKTVYEVTPAQLEALKEIAEQLGVEALRQKRLEMGFGRPPEDPAIFPFLDRNFRAADEPRVVTTLDERDFEDMLRWAREGKGRADHLLVSIHTHEQESGPERPPQFVRNFAHRMIDAGADLVAGHGPHLLRGMEIYRGKPVFHSLGNFFGQNELTYKLPADTYSRFGAEPNSLPADAFVARSQGDTRSFPAFRQYWQSIMPVLSYEGGELSSIEIVPITLGFGQPVHRRGRPSLASGEEAVQILNDFAELSEELGTTIEIDGERGRVQLS